MNEAETRAELIDPKLKENGWDQKLNPEVKVHREYLISAGKIKASGGREKALKADYVLKYHNRMLAVVEAKSNEQAIGEGVGQAKDYAMKLKLDTAYATNGLEIYHINLDSAVEGSVDDYHGPDELWHRTFPKDNQWQDKFNAVPYEDKNGKLPELFKSEDDLRRIWSNPLTRKVLLQKLEDAGFGKDELANLQNFIDAEKSDLFDVLEYIAYAVKPIQREVRVALAQINIFALLDNNQKEFLEFVLSKYIESGVEELDQEQLPHLLELKYHAVSDGAEKLGGVSKIRELFIEFQKHLYDVKVA